MNLEDLEMELSARQGRTRTAYLAAKCRDGIFSCKDLIDLTFYPKGVIAFHAAWVLEHVFLSGDGRAEDWKYFFVRYGEQGNRSCQRHFTKIAICFFNRIRQDDDIDIDCVIERTIEWLADPSTPVAVKANCIDVLYALRQKKEWLTEELTFQLEFIVRNGTSAALQSRSKKFLTKLRKEHLL